MENQEPEKTSVAEQATPTIAEGVTALAPAEGQKKKRTLGNKIFDLAVYPSIAFGAVYFLSTWAVEAAESGKGAVNKLHQGLTRSLEKIVTEKESKNLSLVLISFAVGTLLMAPIKWLEDARSKISKHIDKKLDSAPAHHLHYAIEPKQSWKSVLWGRVVTFLSVLGVSFTVGQRRTQIIKEKAADFMQNQWKRLRPEASEKTLENVANWTKANAFELFYTSLCASLVYVFSRAFARKLNERDEEDKNTQLPVATAPASDEQAVTKDTSWQGRVGSKDTRTQAPENFVKAVDGSRADVSGQHALG